MFNKMINFLSSYQLTTDKKEKKNFQKFCFYLRTRLRRESVYRRRFSCYYKSTILTHTEYNNTPETFLRSACDETHIDNYRFFSTSNSKINIHFRSIISIFRINIVLSGFMFFIIRR